MLNPQEDNKKRFEVTREIVGYSKRAIPISSTSFTYKSSRRQIVFRRA